MQNDLKKILEIDSSLSNLYDRTKLIESSSGQECKSPQVHHKVLEPIPPTTCCGRGCEHCVWLSYFEAHNAWKSLYDGPVLDSTGQ